MSRKFQIIIDCETEHGAFWFVDARTAMRNVLAAVTDEAQSALIMAAGSRTITVKGSRIVATTKEFEYTS